MNINIIKLANKKVTELTKQKNQIEKELNEIESALEKVVKIFSDEGSPQKKKTVKNGYYKKVLSIFQENPKITLGTKDVFMGIQEKSKSPIKKTKILSAIYYALKRNTLSKVSPGHYALKS